MNQKITDFQNYMKANRLAESTIKAYAKTIERYLELYSEFTEKNIIEFYNKQNLTAPVSNQLKKAFSKYFKYQHITDIVLPNSGKHERKPFEVFGWDYFENEIVPTIDLLFAKPLKKKVILYFMVYTGFRPSEIATIKRSQIDITQGCNFQKVWSASVFMKKTQTYRKVFFPTKVKDLLELYFSQEAEESGAFNISAKGIGMIFFRIKKYFPNYNLNPKLLRHVYSNEMFKMTKNLVLLQALRGDKNITTTKQYLHINDDDIKKMSEDVFTQLEKNMKDKRSTK